MCGAGCSVGDQQAFRHQSIDGLGREDTREFAKRRPVFAADAIERGELRDVYVNFCADMRRERNPARARRYGTAPFEKAFDIEIESVAWLDEENRAAAQLAIGIQCRAPAVALF